ncbi:MAG TPA: response regulator [Devosia sp.]|nr:response regulator [Devosia sp.]
MKVLVVEDEPIIRLGLVSSIEDAGYDVIEASNADEALVLLSQDSTVRVVVTDVDMPGSMDGIRLAQLVRRRWPPVQLLVISGKVGVKPGELPEGVRFMSKPYQEPQLINYISVMSGAGGVP